MGLFNVEKNATKAYKEALRAKTDEELEQITKANVCTSFFGLSSGREKQYQMAAFEILRERKMKRSKKCPFCAEQIPDEAIVCKFCGKNLSA